MMDNLRGNFGDLDARDSDEDAYFTDQDAYQHEADAIETPPPAIGNDERRMQVRAYNYWASGLGDRNFPSVDDLDPAKMEDFGPHGVLLDFSKGLDDPIISYLGATIAEECGASEARIHRLSDVPSRSLLSRITDHYMQILANQAPIGFEAEFVNQRGRTVLYRGVLLPYSTNDETIDFILGVINWKELADQKAAEELLLEIDQALGSPATPAPVLLRRVETPAPMVDWADGPGSGIANDDEAVFEPAAAAREMAHEMALGDWLAAAREMAAEARTSEDRSRSALYEAIGRAWDFALAAGDAPREFAELVENAGLTVQERAPMTPVVKLVFGADYDKTRLTEYAAALSHAQRLNLGHGDLAGYLRNSEGGLKGVVTAERHYRKQASGKPLNRFSTAPRAATLRKLRALATQGFDAIPNQGDEFALIMVRRTAQGNVAVLGEVPGNAGLIEKAARSLIG